MTITKEQLYQLYLRKKEDILKQLQKDSEKIHLEVMRYNEIGKLSVTIVYNSNNEDGYLDMLVTRTREIFIDSKVLLNGNEITIDWS